MGDNILYRSVIQNFGHYGKIKIRICRTALIKMEVMVLKCLYVWLCEYILFSGFYQNSPHHLILSDGKLSKLNLGLHMGELSVICGETEASRLYFIDF